MFTVCDSLILCQSWERHELKTSSGASHSNGCCCCCAAGVSWLPDASITLLAATSRPSYISAWNAEDEGGKLSRTISHFTVCRQVGQWRTWKSHRHRSGRTVWKRILSHTVLSISIKSQLRKLLRPLAPQNSRAAAFTGPVVHWSSTSRHCRTDSAGHWGRQTEPGDKTQHEPNL